MAGLLQRFAQRLGLSAESQPDIRRDDVRGKARTESYRGIYSHYWGRYPRDLPPFTFLTAQTMLFDPTIKLGLAMRAAPLYGLQWAYRDPGQDEWQAGIKASSTEVGQFVLRQLDRIWQTDLDAVLTAQIWGWSAGEVTLCAVDGKVEVDTLLPRHANDVRARKRGGDLCGVRVLRCPEAPSGYVDLDWPKAWWHAYNPEAGQWYGQTVLLGCYSPWTDKWMEGGALDVRRLFMHKDAYAGADMTYPEGVQDIPGKGVVPNRDIARELVEQIVAGGVTARPCVYDDKGNELWKLTRATVSSNPAHILQYPKDLDIEILRGMECPDDVLTSGETGAWAGKRVPMSAFYAGLDRWASRVVRDLDECVIRPLVLFNFGPDADYQITHKPLAEQAMEQQGETQQKQQQPGQFGDDGSGRDFGWGDQGGPGGGGPGGGDFPPGSGPGRMSLDVAERVGRGELSAERIVSAARRVMAIRLGDRQRSLFAEEETDPWVRYVGPRGGQGWRNTLTGDIAYQDEKPGRDYKPKEAPKPAEFESNKGKQSVLWRGLKTDLPGQRDFIEEADSKEAEKQSAAEPRRGRGGLTVDEAMDKAGVTGKRANYGQSVSATFHYTGTSAADWQPVGVKKFGETQDDAGNVIHMPEFDFPQGYDHVETPFTSQGGGENACCELCGTPIKNVWHIQSDKHKLTMNVGSECVTHFGAGDTGERAAKRSVAQANREFIDNLIKAKGRLQHAHMQEMPVYDHARNVKIGSRRVWNVGENGRKAKELHAKLGEALTHQKAEVHNETGWDKTHIWSDRQIANWLKAKREAVETAYKAANDFLEGAPTAAEVAKSSVESVNSAEDVEKHGVDHPEQVRVSEVDTPAQGDLAEARRAKNATFARLKELRQQVKDAGPQAGNLRLELLKARSKYNEALLMEKKALRAIESRAQELGQTTVKMATDGPSEPEGRWITIGGRKKGDSEHVGGFPVPIAPDGRIIAGGPRGLRGKKVSDVGKYFKRSRARKKSAKQSRDIYKRQAESWGMDPDEYRKLSDEIYQTQTEHLQAREAAKKEARRRLEVTQADISRWENQGFDVGGKMGSRFDTVGRELASEYPDLGWGRGAEEEVYSDVDHAQKLWELLSEGKRDIPAKNSEEFHQAVTDYLAVLEKQYGEGAAEEADPEPKDWDAVPFGLQSGGNRQQRMGQFREEDHPRGQPDNAGEFVKKDKQGEQEATAEETAEYNNYVTNMIAAGITTRPLTEWLNDYRSVDDDDDNDSDDKPTDKNDTGQKNKSLPDEARPELTDEERQEVQLYLEEDTPYYATNKALRSGSRVASSDVNTLQNAILKASVFSKPIVAKRGLVMDDLSDLVAELQSGVFIDRGFMSASTKPRGAFAGNVQFKIRVRHGLDASYYGYNSGEVLLPSGSEFRVVKFKQTGQEITAELEQIVNHETGGG